MRLHVKKTPTRRHIPWLWLCWTGSPLYVFYLLLLSTNPFTLCDINLPWRCAIYPHILTGIVCYTVGCLPGWSCPSLRLCSPTHLQDASTWGVNLRVPANKGSLYEMLHACETKASTNWSQLSNNNCKKSNKVKKIKCSNKQQLLLTETKR